VDNAEIFKMISPAFSTLIGGMIGFLSGIKLNQDDEKKPVSKPPCQKDENGTV
jgi:hypothetical protein